MGTERRRQLVLGAIVVVLIVVLAKMWPGTSAAPSPAHQRAEGADASGPAQASPAAAEAAPAPAPTSSAVHLDALTAERPKPAASERNLFRFKTKAPPPPPPAAVRSAQPVAPVNAAPAGPPPLAPITLKFIGVVDAPTQGGKIAILSDGKNAPFYGKEGAIIEGRYRILKIGVESVELAYADGRGRQTIRLTGS
jgi:hypothetical protein